MLSTNAYGVTSRSGATAELELAQEQLRVQGLCILEDVLSASQVDDYNTRIDQVYATQCDEVGGAAALREISDEDIVRCPLAYDPKFIDLAGEPRVIELIKSVLGDNVVLLMQNAIINRPDRVQAQAKWHRDLNYQHWVCSKPLALSALVCLEDFTVQTGGTVFLPGSHKFEPFPSETLVESLSFTPQARKGSVLVFDAMTFHRAGTNRSGRMRRAVNHVVGLPILGQQVDIPSMLGEAPADPWLSGFLGFRWNPVKNVREWRQRKINTASSSARGAA